MSAAPDGLGFHPLVDLGEEFFLPVDNPEEWTHLHGHWVRKDDAEALAVLKTGDPTAYYRLREARWHAKRAGRAVDLPSEDD